MKDETTITIKTNPKFYWWRVPLVFGIQTGIIGIGIWADSQAMQWSGFVAVILLAVGASIAASERDRGLTISEARKRLAEIERRERA